MARSHLTGDVIESQANPGIKLIRALQRRKIRHQERAFVVEGVRAVEDTLQSGLEPRAIYVRDDFDLDLLPDFPTNTVVRRVTGQVFDGLTDVPHPQGVLAVVPMLPDVPVPLPATVDEPLLLVVDGVRDPGNLGTLLRSAAGAGVDHVVMGPETVDTYHPRAVRAAMGAHFRVPFSAQPWQRLREYLEEYPIIAVADANGDTAYDRVDWTGPAAIIIGGEAFGPTADAWHVSNVRVNIPLQGGVESLNAGVAGSLLLFETSRQRRAVRRVEKG